MWILNLGAIHAKALQSRWTFKSPNANICWQVFILPHVSHISSFCGSIVQAYQLSIVHFHLPSACVFGNNGKGKVRPKCAWLLHYGHPINISHDSSPLSYLFQLSLTVVLTPRPPPPSHQLPRSAFTASSETDTIYIISRTYSNTHSPSFVTWIHRGMVSSFNVTWLNSQGQKKEKGKHWGKRRGRRRGGEEAGERVRFVVRKQQTIQTNTQLSKYSHRLCMSCLHAYVRIEENA